MLVMEIGHGSQMASNSDAPSGRRESHVVDFRVRPPCGSFLDLGIFDKSALQSYSRKGVAPSEAFMRSDMGLFWEEMDEAGIDLAVIVGRSAEKGIGSVPNEEVAELVRLYPDRLVGFGSISERRTGSALRQVKFILNDLNLAGIAFDPGWQDPPCYVDEGRLYPIYAAVEEAGAPLIIAVSAFIGPDISYTDPARIQRVAKDFPELNVVIAHAAWPSVVAFLGVCFTTKNIWVQPDFYAHVPNMPGASHYAEALNYYLKERFLYASAYPARPLGSSIGEFLSLPMDEETAAAALGDNALRLLGPRLRPEARARVGVVG